MRYDCFRIALFAVTVCALCLLSTSTASAQKLSNAKLKPVEGDSIDSLWEARIAIQQARWAQWAADAPKRAAYWRYRSDPENHPWEYPESPHLYTPRGYYLNFFHPKPWYSATPHTVFIVE